MTDVNVLKTAAMGVSLMKVRLDMIIEYEGVKQDQIDFYEVEQQLCSAAEHLYDNGLLSGNYDFAVSSCTHEVTLLDEGEEAK